MKEMRIWILALFASYSLCEDLQKYSDSAADITSINNLAYKPRIMLDPKIRKALLNVLNRLEEQDSAKLDTQPDTETYSESEIIPTADDDVKWEYKSNDTFKEYKYYETAADQDSDKKFNNDENNNRDSDSKPDIEDDDDQLGALFFQVPEKQNPSSADKHESLKEQETKNAFSDTADLLLPNYREDSELDVKTEERTQKSTNISNTTTVTAAPAPAPTPTPQQKSTEINEKDVEVFQAPLLTAFTLEQDERGLPRRIIPLETEELNSILNSNKIQAELEDGRKTRQRTFSSKPINVAPFLQNEQKRYTLELQSHFQQLQLLQERNRQLELEKERFFAEQDKARRLRFAFEQKQKEKEIEYFRALNQNEIPSPEIAFQKSVETQFPIPIPVFDKPSPFVQTYNAFPTLKQTPQIYFPDTVDKQLQNLFLTSGITHGHGRQEDLNIVSKVLALNHEGDEDTTRTTEKEKFRRENTEFYYG